MSGQTLVFVAVVGLIIVYAVVRALWRAWVISRVRKAAAAATPAVDRLAATISAFHARFPVPAAARLPMDPEDYPAPRPRKPSAPRSRTRSRRRTYRRRYR